MGPKVGEGSGNYHLCYPSKMAEILPLPTYNMVETSKNNFSFLYLLLRLLSHTQAQVSNQLLGFSTLRTGKYQFSQAQTKLEMQIWSSIHLLILESHAASDGIGVKVGMAC